jgi:hypothetical protein
MTDHNRFEIRQFILAYEELDENQRRRADALLAENEGLRRQLRWVQAIEQRATAPLPEGQEDFWARTALDPQAAEAERRCYLRLREVLRLAREPGIGGSGQQLPDDPWWRRWLGWDKLLLVPAAAVLVFALILPLDRQEGVLLRDLSVGTLELVPGSDRAGRIVDSRLLSTGQAVALRFFLEHDAHVLVFHVDPAGNVELAVPASPNQTPPRLTGNRSHRLPDAKGGEDWILGFQTGQETFVLGIDPGWGAHETAQLHKLVTSHVSGPERELVVSNLLDALAVWMQQTERIDLDHVD